MAKRKPPMLDAPIPGQSLTAEPGARPWEKPSRYSTIEDTLSFYIDNLSQPKKMANLLDKIEEGAPLTLIADSLQTIGVMKGIHSLDVGILITPVLIEFMKASSEQAEVEYTIGIEDDGVANEEDESMATQIANDLFSEKRFVDELVEGEPEEPAEVMEETEESAMPQKGLMARRMTEEVA